MQYRTFGEPDYPTLQALDLAAQRAHSAEFDQLADRERDGRLHTSLPALKFYERSEHSFVADDGEIRGFVFAQSLWQGDRPVVLVRTLTSSPELTPEQAETIIKGLMHAVVKSAYDCAVYEVHYPVNAETEAAAQAEESHVIGRYGVIHLGTRAQTAPGEKLTNSVRTPEA